MLPVVFKGGSMDGTEITYQEEENQPVNEDVMFIETPYIDKRQVYVYIANLFSWVNDHESVVIEEHGEGAEE